MILFICSMGGLALLLLQNMVKIALLNSWGRSEDSRIAGPGFFFCFLYLFEHLHRLEACLFYICLYMPSLDLDFASISSL